MGRTMLVTTAVFAALTLVAAGCGGDGGETIDVVLSEFIVEPDTDAVGAGEVTFAADNQGGETHELVVAEAESAEDLPTDENGAVDEEALGEASILGEIEDVASGGEAELTLDLDAGTYVMFCNIVEEEETGEVESHFAEGMHATLTVE